MMKVKMFIAKQTLKLKQRFNGFLGRRLSPAGKEYYKYLMKVSVEDYKPETYADTLHESSLMEYLEGHPLKDKMDRCSAAAELACCMAQFYPYKEFWAEDVWKAIYF